jgi:hypothetical protein
MAEESLKLKEMSLRMRDFDVVNNTKHEPLQERFKSSIDEIASQKQKFMDQLRQVSIMHGLPKHEAGLSEVVGFENIHHRSPRLISPPRFGKHLLNQNVRSANCEWMMWICKLILAEPDRVTSIKLDLELVGCSANLAFELISVRCKRNFKNRARKQIGCSF